mmetsp:Transcript_1715/g.4030  ORF Transcript_1715/g.4030 Transcript_1715/m.4030 type:complete len:760 (+) Transcript_1715:451-2730(+)
MMQQRGKRRTAVLCEGEVVDFVLNSKQVLDDREIVQGLEQLNTDGAAKCMQCKKTSVMKLVAKYNQDIGCSGCVRQLKQRLEGFSLCRGGLMGSLFEETSDGMLRLRPQFQHKDHVGKVFSAFNSQAYFNAKKGGSKRQRCSLHTASPRMDEPWIQVWEDMPTEVQERIARLEIHELSNQLTDHLKQLYFCRDCRGNVLKALDLLVGFMDPFELEDHDEYAPEYYRPFLLGNADDTFWSLVDCTTPNARRLGHGGSSVDSDGDADSTDSKYDDDEDDDLGELDDVDSTDFPIDLDEYKVRSVSPQVEITGSEKLHPHDIHSNTVERRSSRSLKSSRSNQGEAVHQPQHKRSLSSSSCDCMECTDNVSGDDNDDDEDDDDDDDFITRHLSEDNDNLDGGHGHAHSHNHADHGHQRHHHHNNEHGHGHHHTHSFSRRSEEEEDYQDGDSNSYAMHGASHLLINLDDVLGLIQRSEDADARDELNRQNGGSSDRHAPTLKDGQMELLHCIGKVLLDRIRDTWIDQLIRGRTGELLAWLTLSCMRTNMQTAIQSKSEETLYMLLEEEEHREKERKDGKKKKRKNKSKKKKKGSSGKSAEDGEEDEDEDLRKTSLAEATFPTPGITDVESVLSNRQYVPKVAKSSGADISSDLHRPDNGLSTSTVKFPMSEWDQACEARLLAQFGASASKFDGANEYSHTFSSSFSDLVSSLEQDDSDEEDEGLTEDEIREAQMQLKRMMGTSSRAELRANLRERFYSLSQKST